ncbi:MAG: histidine phosphatase family protein [Alphaproteobacteria bacterium]|nr:histidine phosphatase family protein [Alphaproteobacteria bacterium]
MPKLYLLRHGQAASSFNQEDKDRPLTQHGVSQASSLASHVQDIQKTLCSSAKRTQMTARAVQSAGGNLGNIEYQDHLYNASAGDLLSAIQECSSENILIVAHNPGIHLLARSLADKGDEAQLEKLNIFYNPATLSIFECDVENWSDIKPQSNRLLDLIIPEL